MTNRRSFFKRMAAALGVGAATVAATPLILKSTLTGRLEPSRIRLRDIERNFWPDGLDGRGTRITAADLATLDADGYKVHQFLDGTTDVPVLTPQGMPSGLMWRAYTREQGFLDRYVASIEFEASRADLQRMLDQPHCDGRRVDILRTLLIERGINPEDWVREPWRFAA